MFVSSSDGSVRDIAVPLELFDLILNNFASDCEEFRTDLKSFCVVSKCWVPACRLRLFREVEVGLPKKNRRGRIKLAQIIESDASIATFIRHIKYSLPFNINLNEEAEGEDARLLALLQIPNAKSLNIACVRRSYATAGTHYFGWRSVLDRYVSVGLLTSISLTGISNLPILDIFSSASLSNLELLNCTIANKPAPKIPSVEAIATGFNLTRFKADSVKNLWLPFLTLCSHLGSIDVNNVLLDQRNAKIYFETQPPVTFPHATSLLMCDTSMNGWETLLSTAWKSGTKVFPAVTELDICISNPNPEDEEMSRMIKLYPHLQALKTLKVTAICLQVIGKEVHLYTLDLHVLTLASRDSLTDITLTVEPSIDMYVYQSLLDIYNWLCAIKRRNVLQSLNLTVYTWTSTEDIWVSSFEEWEELGAAFTNYQVDFPRLKDISVDLTFYCQREERNIWSVLPHHEYNYRSILDQPLAKLVEAPDINFQSRIEVDFEHEFPIEVLLAT